MARSTLAWSVRKDSIPRTAASRRAGSTTPPITKHGKKRWGARPSFAALQRSRGAARDQGKEWRPGTCFFSLSLLSGGLLAPDGSAFSLSLSLFPPTWRSLAKLRARLPQLARAAATEGAPERVRGTMRFNNETTSLLGMFALLMRLNERHRSGPKRKGYTVAVTERIRP